VGSSGIDLVGEQPEPAFDLVDLTGPIGHLTQRADVVCDREGKRRFWYGGRRPDRSPLPVHRRLFLRRHLTSSLGVLDGFAVFAHGVHGHRDVR
jgi:hypothetical protein